MDRKKMLIIGGGVAAVLLVWYLYSRNKAASGGTSSQTNPGDTIGTALSPNASDYANLATQLQQQGATEQGDVYSLTQKIQALAKYIRALSVGNRKLAHDLKMANQRNKELSHRQHRLKAQVLAQEKVDKKIEAELRKLMHQRKTGHKNRAHGNHHNHPASGGAAMRHHRNHHHPAGTGGHAVAPRHHGGTSHHRKQH
jgi:hypothetical protein